MGGPVVHAARDRAARSTAGPPPSSSTCTRPRTATSSSATTRPSTGRPTARARSATSRSPSCAASTTPTGGRRARTCRPGSTTTRTRCGAARRVTRRSGRHARRGARARWPGVVVNLDIKRTAPDVEPYEALLADALREHERGDDTIVASFSDAGDRRVPRGRPRVPDVARHLRDRGVLPRDPRRRRGARDRPPSRSRCPATFGELTVVDELVRRARPRCGPRGARLDDQRRGRDAVAASTLGVDGIISDTPTTLVEVLAAAGCAWGGLGG